MTRRRTWSTRGLASRSPATRRELHAPLQPDGHGPPRQVRLHEPRSAADRPRHRQQQPSDERDLRQVVCGPHAAVTWWESDLRLGGYRNTIAFVDLPDTATSARSAPSSASRARPRGRFKVERKEAGVGQPLPRGQMVHKLVRSRAPTRMRAGAWARRSARRATRFGVLPGAAQVFRATLPHDGRARGGQQRVRSQHTERGSLAWVIKESGTRIRGGAGSASARRRSTRCSSQASPTPRSSPSELLVGCRR